MLQSVPREFTLPRRIGALIHEARRKRMFDKLSTFRNLYGVGNAFDGKGKKIKGSMQEEYGSKKGEEIFYASINKGKIKGAEKKGKHSGK